MSSQNLAYTKKTLSKALFWLEQQPREWAHHVNADTAVRLYLQSKEQQEVTNHFTKELKKYCTPSSELIKEEIKTPAASPSASTQSTFNVALLDLKSQELIQQTKEDLNLTDSEETLRVLLQIGYKSLKSFLKS